MLLWDIVTSLQQHGITHYLFVNGHGGNMVSLATMSLKMRYELDVQIAVMFYLRLASDIVAEGARTKLYGHACEVEASVGLHLAPQTVRADDLQEGAVKPYDHAFTDIKAAARVNYPFLFDDFTENGALGDARHATEEFGRDIIDTTIERTMAFLETFLA